MTWCCTLNRCVLTLRRVPVANMLLLQHATTCYEAALTDADAYMWHMFAGM